MRIAQLVARIYIGPAPTGHKVSHIDGNNLNNHSCNLEYVHRPGNSAALMAIEMRQRQILRKHIASRRVEKMQRWRAQNLSLKEIGERMGISTSMVSRVLRGERWQHATRRERAKRRRK